MSEVPAPQIEHSPVPIQPVLLKNTEPQQNKGFQESNVLPENGLHEQPPSKSKIPVMAPSTEPTQAHIPKPIYTSTFTKDVSESLERCGLQVDYINPTPLGEGANHMVYTYDIPNEPPKVLKIAKEKSSTTLTHDGAKGEQQGKEIAKNSFGPYTADTTIIVDPQNEDKYYVIQESVKGKPVTNTRFKNNSAIQKQLADIVKQNNKLYTDKKMCLDFVGMAGFTGWFKKQFGKLLLRKSEFEVSNVIESDEGKLKIIDFEYFDLNDNIGIRKKVTNFIGMTVNRLLMKHYFGLDIKKG